VWEPRARAGAQLVNEPGTWMMSSLHTPEPAAPSTFFGALFGGQPEPLEELTLYRLAGHSGGEPGRALPRDVVAVMAPTGGDGSPDAIPPHWNVNFRVTDADATAERAAALGGTVIAAPQDTPGFRSAVLGDPAGAAFSVSQLVA
jgi:predicted enzyme related to lactoylglutathione lyase